MNADKFADLVLDWTLYIGGAIVILGTLICVVRIAGQFLFGW